MSDVVKRLRDRRLNVWNQATEISDRASEENREFSPEEQGAWDALNTELDRLDARIKSAIDTEKRAKEADEAFNALERQPVKPGIPGASNGPSSERAAQTEQELRSFLLGEQGSPRAITIRPEGRVDFRTLSKLTAAAGANTVPTSFYDQLVAHMIETSAMLRAGVTVLNTNSGETIQIPKTTAHSSGAIVTEGSPIAASDPAFGQQSLGSYKYGVLVQVSRELVDDTAVDLIGYLSMETGRALGNAFGAHLVTGTGTGQPRGVVTDATLGVTGGTGVGGAFTGDNLIDLYYSVIAPYRNSSAANWLMKDSTVATARKIKDTTGQYIWQPGLVAGAPDSILGKNVLTDPNVASVATSAKSVLFGDFSQYFVRLVGGVRFERSDDYAFNTDLVTYRALLRGDGALVDLTGAIKYFAGAAT